MSGPAGRTRWNTNFELIGTGRPLRRRDPSRQVTRRAAAGPAASSKALTVDHRKGQPPLLLMPDRGRDLRPPAPVGYVLVGLR
jgi:hypothetical protein